MKSNNNSTLGFFIVLATISMLLLGAVTTNPTAIAQPDPYGETDAEVYFNVPYPSTAQQQEQEQQPEQEQEQQPLPTEEEMEAIVCDPSYPNTCLPTPPPDLDCGPEVGNQRNIAVSPPDPHKLDRDNDGFGCDLPSQQVVQTVEAAIGNDTAVVAEEQVIEATEESEVEETEEPTTEEAVQIYEVPTYANVLVHVQLAIASIHAGNSDSALTEVEIAIGLLHQIAAHEAQQQQQQQQTVTTTPETEAGVEPESQVQSEPVAPQQGGASGEQPLVGGEEGYFPPSHTETQEETEVEEQQRADCDCK